MTDSLSNTSNEHTSNGYTRRWWKEAVVYQIYPRSFKDSNGDGIGDLNGITEKLDYIQELGVDVIWLSPIFKSPNADNGYDIADYQEIMTEFGTMDDFDHLLRAVKARGLRLVLDLVANHTSDEHIWFVESRQSKDNPYRDYYIWRPGKNGTPPNNWVSYFSGSAWEYDAPTDEYYLHLFAKKQPDLNWDNSKVRREIYNMMHFWLSKGVDGFRMDVIPFISKDPAFPDFPADYDGNYGKIYASGPKLHDYIQEMHREVLSQYDIMTVGEAAGITLEQTPLLVDERRQELNMIFQFDVVSLDREGDFWTHKPYQLSDFKAIFTRYEQTLDSYCWNAIFLSNHDCPRPVSRFASDAPPFRVPAAKMLATFLLTMKGTPYIYQGDEIGMTNYPFGGIETYDDINARNAWQAQVLEAGADPQAFLANLLKTSRDHARTCMQWDDSAHAGFSTADRTWFVVHPNYPQVNVAQAVADPDSVLHYFKALLALRKATPTLIYGDFYDLDPNHPQVFAYTRTLDAARYLIVLNFSSTHLSYELPANLQPTARVIGNYGPDATYASMLHLRPWEAIVFETKSS